MGKRMSSLCIQLVDASVYDEAGGLGSRHVSNSKDIDRGPIPNPTRHSDSEANGIVDQCQTMPIDDEHGAAWCGQHWARVVETGLA